MSERHVINLSTAWEPPADGSRTWVRRFGRPSGIEPGGIVWLAVEGGSEAAIMLNGVGLPAACARHEITPLLEARNELLVIPLAIAPTADSGVSASHARVPLPACHGRIWLEIETGIP